MSFQSILREVKYGWSAKALVLLIIVKMIQDKKQNIQLNKFDHYLVPVGDWHQITIPLIETCHLIEIQYGEDCVEDDIERLNIIKKNNFKSFYIYYIPIQYSLFNWLDGRVVMQRPAKPFTPVRFRLQPP